MPRGAQAAEAERSVSPEQLVHHRARTAGRVQRRSVGAGAHYGVGVEVAAARLGGRANRVDIGLRVHRRHGGAIGLGGLAPLEPEPSARLELRLDRRDARLVLGMRAGVVLERARVVEIERRTDLGTVIRP
jgi:hypothetical protein